MTNQTIKKLNQLNLDFYKTVHTSFDQTRSNPWKGWDSIIEHITALAEKKSKVSILDIGCGNGRFYSFLTSILDSEKIIFTGVDSDENLLSLAKEKIKQTDQTQNVDIVAKLLKSDSLGLNNQTFDLVVMFGVLHHIPSKKLRTSLVTNIVDMLNNDGIAVIANWQFADDARYKKRFISPEEISANSDELEPNDYILDWQKGERALRYCHHTTDEEMKNIVSRAKGKIIDSYFADGKSGRLNRYYVIGKV